MQWGRKNNLSEFLLIKNINGIVAGCAMLVILASATLLRKLQYETFHIIHITMAALILITSGMHRPDIPMVGKIVIIAASLWIADRALRIGKLALYNFGNTATVTNLPHGGTRIVLKKTPIGATPGTHCFLWIPRVRATESHPFTVLSTDPFGKSTSPKLYFRLGYFFPLNDFDSLQHPEAFWARVSPIYLKEVY